MIPSWQERPELSAWNGASKDARSLLCDLGTDDESVVEVLAAWIALTRFHPEVDVDGLWSQVDRAARALDEVAVLEAMARVVDPARLVAEMTVLEAAESRATQDAMTASLHSLEALRIFRRLDTLRLAMLGAWRLPLPEDRRHEITTVRATFSQTAVAHAHAHLAVFSDLRAYVAQYLKGVREDLADVDPDLDRTLDLWRFLASS